MSTLEQSLASLIEQHGLSHLRSRIMGAAKPSIRLVSAAATADGHTQFGGEVALLPTPRWPESNGCALPLLAQIDLTSLPPVAHGLPASGWLSFFYDFEELPEGGGSDRTGYEVIYTPDPSTAHALPADTSTISIKLDQAASRGAGHHGSSVPVDRDGRPGFFPG